MIKYKKAGFIAACILGIGNAVNISSRNKEGKWWDDGEQNTGGWWIDGEL